MISIAFGRQIFRCISGVGLLLILTAGAGAQEFKIKLVRPARAGDQYHVVTTAKISSSADITVGGQPQPKDVSSMTLELKGVVTVAAINPKTGTATKISCKVEKLTKDGVELYPAGTVIVAEKDHKFTLQVDGKPADEKTSELLQNVLDVSDPNSSTNDDELTGTDKPQKVGGTWPINSEKVAAQIAAGGLPVTAEQTRGQGTLVKITRQNNADVMEIHAVATAEGFKKDMGDGSSISDGKLKIETTNILPVDPTRPSLSIENRSHATMVYTQGNIKAIETLDRDIKSDAQPIKP